MRSAATCALFVLAACGSGPIAPEWESRSHASLERFRQHYLEGDTRLARRNFADAQAAIAATGRPELAARAELVRCALGVAALDEEACAGFDGIKSDAAGDDRIYGEFVMGQGRDQDVGRLPPQYREVASARSDGARLQALRRIKDPVSRLVAAGALFRRAQLSPEGLELAVESASDQGYRRALLAYLNVQAKHAQSAGDTPALQAIQKRIDLVYRSLPGPAP